MWGWVKKKAKAALKAVKQAAQAAGNFVSGAAAGIWGLISAALHFVLSIFDVLLTSFGNMVPKKTRLYVKILSNEKGPLINRKDHLSQYEWSKLIEALREARRIFEKELNTTVIPASDTEAISVIAEPAPEAALKPRGGGGCVLDVIGTAGDFYRWHEQRNIGSYLLGYGAPITVFIVDEIQNGDDGVSPGPAGNYVVVDLEGIKQSPSWTLAHELGHACNLLGHGGAEDSLMRHDPDGRMDYLKRWQKVIIRASRHVTIG
jgi:hypothetical protein